MPCLNLSTNVNLDGVDTSSILSEATSTVATLIGKPEAYVMIVLKGSVPISFGGNEQPAAYGELVSIGGLSPDANKKLSAAIASILETQLSVPKSRFFLKFYDTKSVVFFADTMILNGELVMVLCLFGRVLTLDGTVLHSKFHVTLVLAP